MNDCSPTRVGFLLFPDFPMIELVAAIEPLKYANNALGATRYLWQLFTVTDSPVASGNGLLIAPTAPFSKTKHTDMLFLCSGQGVERHFDSTLSACLASLSSNRTMILGALSTGSYLLAKAGLLTEHRCTVHRTYVEVMRHEFPRLDITNKLFELDRRRYTCSGGTASIDMLLHVIRREYGPDVCVNICQDLAIDRIRRSDERCTAAEIRVPNAPTYVKEAITLMEYNIEEPLLVSEIAAHVQVSKRQLERAFLVYFEQGPHALYLAIRLAKGRDLLRNSNLSVTQIAATCGFSSAQHFSKSYRDHFNRRPTDERDKPRRSNWTLPMSVSA